MKGCYRSQILLPWHISLQNHSESMLLSFVLLSDSCYILSMNMKASFADEHLLNKIQRIVKVGVYELDIIGNKLSWSDEMYRIFGADPNTFEATYEAFLHFVHPDDRDTLNNTFQRAIQNKENYEIRHRVLRDDGTVLHVNAVVHFEYDDAGNVISAIGTVQDISTIVEKEEQLTIITDTSPDAIIMISLKGEILFWNPAAEKIFGYKRDEALGKNLLDILAPQRYKNLFRAEFSAFRSKKVQQNRLELIGRHKDGHEIDTLISLGSVEAEGNTQIVAIVRDNSERKENEQLLQQHREYLEKAKKITHLGIFVIQGSFDKMEWSDEIYDIFKQDKNTFIPSLPVVMELIHPEDRNSLADAIIRAETVTGEYHLRVRLIVDP